MEPPPPVFVDAFNFELGLLEFGLIFLSVFRLSVVYLDPGSVEAPSISLIFVAFLPSLFMTIDIILEIKYKHSKNYQRQI